MKMSTLLPSILIACQGSKTDSGPIDNNEECEWGYCYGVCMEPYERDYVFSVSQAEFDTYLDTDGLLTESKCEELCVVKIQEEGWANVDQIQECTHIGPDTDTDDSQELACNAILKPYCEGRLHEGARGAEDNGGLSAKAAWLARAAHCEATSVASFLQLRAHLKHLNAPIAFLERCLIAAQQEVAHAQLMTRHAHREGGRIAPLSFGDFTSKSRVELAIENVVHGVVNEGFAALMALHQSVKCPDLKLRETMRIIAKEEVEHVQLAVDLHQWLISKLSKAEKERVEKSKREALAKLKTHWLNRQSSDLDHELGLPTPELGLRLSVAFAAA